MKKNILIFLAGMLSCFVILVAIGKNVKLKSKTPVVQESNSSLTLLDEPGDCVQVRDFRVIEVMPSGDALAEGFNNGFFEVLFLKQEGKAYYEGQVIPVPEDKCARQIGIYKQKKYGSSKTLAVIEIQ